ncbi:MAG TPA: hypothetical protein VK907_06545 [Phnomibacter sp.]|nr:hypothetical protein [Phnomibacter sp.]
MDNNDPIGPENRPTDPNNADLEREMLEMKLRAEFGMTDGYMAPDIPPELAKQFLEQIYAFEKGMAGGKMASVAESVGVPPFETWPAEEMGWEQGEKLVEGVLEWYRQQHFEIVFEQAYPPQVKYQFLTEIFPAEPNPYGGKPSVPSVIQYEQFVPNHAADIEANANHFLESFFERNAGGMKDVMWRDQVAPGYGPYDGQLLIEYLEHWFGSLAGFSKHKFTILQVSYDRVDEDNAGETMPDDPDELPPGPFGMGYAEGLMGYIAESLVQTEPIKQAGPFKLYFEWRQGHWGIVYPDMPGLPIPPGE